MSRMIVETNYSKMIMITNYNKIMISKSTKTASTNRKMINQDRNKRVSRKMIANKMGWLTNGKRSIVN